MEETMETTATEVMLNYLKVERKLLSIEFAKLLLEENGYTVTKQRNKE